MTSKQHAADVDAAISLERQIASLETELGEIKKRLIKEAVIVLRDPNGANIKDDLAGSSQTFKGSGGAIARINFPRAKLISSFYLDKDDVAWRTVGMGKNAQTMKLGPLVQWAGEQFKNLFAKSFKPAKAFREILPVLIKNDSQRAKILAAVETPSSPSVSFEIKETHAPELLGTTPKLGSSDRSRHREHSLKA